LTNIGIIGCGKIAQVRHLPEYAANSNANLVGVFDRSIERAQDISKLYGGKVYASYEEMLSDPEIDAVSVCVANVVHAEISIAALNAGKHVLCEKPMAMTLAECEAMVEASEKSGKYLMIGHNQRLTKSHVKAKALIESGIIGELITFRTVFAHSGPENWSIRPGKNTWFFDKNVTGLGAMSDLGINKTDLIQYLMGSRIVETTATMATINKRGADGELVEVDDNAICIYRMASGAVGTMTVSWTNYGIEDNSTIICGTKGVMKIYSDPDYSIVIELENGESIHYVIDQIQTNDNQTASGVIDLFVDSIVTQTPPEMDGEEALSAMKVIFTNVESAKTGKTIKI
jgi:predicted dehydrogenase